MVKQEKPQIGESYIWEPSGDIYSIVASAHQTSTTWMFRGLRHQTNKVEWMGFPKRGHSGWQKV